MSLGSLIRDRRKEVGLSVRDLAERSGFSPSYVSLLERDMVNPSVAALKRVAASLGISVASLMDGPDQRSASNVMVVRSNRRKAILYPGSDIRFELLSPDLNRKIEFLWLTVPPGTESGEDGYWHEGEECLVVVKGELELWLEEEKYVLFQGDSVYFESHVPHRWRNSGEEEAVVVWAITPPTF